MKDAILALRVEPELKKELELLAKVLHISSTELVRTKLAFEVKELIEKHKFEIAKAFMDKKISRKEAELLLGKESMADIDFIHKTNLEMMKDIEKRIQAEKNK